MGKYFTITAKPTIPPITAGQGAPFGDNDVLFDWYAFDIPKGASRLIGATVEMRPRSDTAATMQAVRFELLFAKTLRGEAPPTLGPLNDATVADTNYGGHLLNFLDSLSWETHESHIDSTAFTVLKRTVPSTIVIQGEPDSGTNVGYDKIYIGGISAGAIDYRSLIRINNGTLDGDTFTVDGADPRLSLRPGDVIIATPDHSTTRTLGTIKSMPDANTIVLDATTENAVVNDDYIHNYSPITINLHFER